MEMDVQQIKKNKRKFEVSSEYEMEVRGYTPKPKTGKPLKPKGKPGLRAK